MSRGGASVAPVKEFAHQQKCQRRARSAKRQECQKCDCGPPPRIRWSTHRKAEQERTPHNHDSVNENPHYSSRQKAKASPNPHLAAAPPNRVFSLGGFAGSNCGKIMSVSSWLAFSRNRAGIFFALKNSHRQFGSYRQTSLTQRTTLALCRGSLPRCLPICRKFGISLMLGIGPGC